MLHIQEYLRSGKTPADLTDDLGIKSYESPCGRLVGFKYNQIDSPKTNPIVREARGIVLEKGTWNVVAKGFSRFFNVGEVTEEFETFDWSNFTLNAKEDGSLILLYHYEGEWNVNTSGSFGHGEAGHFDGTWRELFWQAAPFTAEDLPKHGGMTYIFELCSPYNKVVRTYRKPKLFLLGVTETNTPIYEFPHKELDYYGALFGVETPETLSFGSQGEVKQFLLAKEEEDATFEGVVLRDGNGLRYKWKTATYVSLHRLKDNGNILLPKRIVPIVLANETDEVIATMPEVTSAFRAVEDRLDKAIADLVGLWASYKNLESQKDFAMAVKHHKLAGLLFRLRKTHGAKATSRDLEALWRESGATLIKCLFRKDETFDFDIEEVALEGA